jgi:hypothetical protein
MHFYIFTVRGKGEFPFDMLRYDCCHPHTGEDSAQMSIPMGDDRKNPREVELLAYTDNRYWTPTTGRWNSFMWPIVDKSIRKQY